MGDKRSYIRSFGFSIPAIAGIVSHLVVHVLPETQLIFGDTDFSKVEVDPPDKISQDGVIDHSLNETEDENQTSTPSFWAETKKLTKANYY